MSAVWTVWGVKGSDGEFEDVQQYLYRVFSDAQGRADFLNKFESTTGYTVVQMRLEEVI